MLPMLMEMKIRFVTCKSLYKYKLFPVDDRAAHTSVAQIKSWEFTWGWVLHCISLLQREKGLSSSQIQLRSVRRPPTRKLKLLLWANDRVTQASSKS